MLTEKQECSFFFLLLCNVDLCVLGDALGSAGQGTGCYEVLFEIGVELSRLQVNVFLYTDRKSVV